VGLSCDYFGRKYAIVVTTVFIVFGSIMCAASYGTTVQGMFWMLTVFRGVIGWGVGGEYSACSSASSESANETVKRRGGTFIMVTNLPLSLGGPFAIIVFLIVLSAAGNDHLKEVWRICFGLGVVWPLCIFYFRYRMNQGLLYKKSSIKKDVPYLLVFKYYWRRLLGTCGCWFIYDFVVFPNGVFSSSIISSIIKDKNDLMNVGEWTLLLSVLSLPGVFIGASVVDKIGRRNCLMIGFAGYLVIGLIIGLAYEKLSKIVPLFIIFYGLFNSMGNFGPGNCIGLVSAESFATPVRGTLYGLSAAMGKTGAAVGTQAFTSIQNNLGKKWTFIISAILGTVGVMLAYFTIPQLKDDDLMVADLEFERYLRLNGWKGTFGTESESDNDEETTETESYDDIERVDVSSPTKS
jgi:MFS family permease